MSKRFILLYSLLFFSLIVSGRTITPFDFGLADCKSGEERFWALFNAHAEALKTGSKVDYTGIKQIDIEIPAKARSIALGEQTDFNGAIFNVHNTKKAYFCLFTMMRKANSLNVSKSDVCTYSFGTYPELNNGIKLLIIEDKTPWIERRIGNSYGHQRKDVLVIKDGQAQNETISPYSNDISSPICSFVDETGDKKFFKNLTFYRTEDSTEKTLLLKVQYYNDIEISGVNIYTSNPNNWHDDYTINIKDCANLTIKDVIVDGTYSLKDRFGYAICLTNVFNVTVINMYGDAAWGVFDCNNINKATIINSDLNRFDLHCYGRDYTFKKCTIRQSAPLSSMFGKVFFLDCVFEHAHPCLYRTDYNAYTPFDLEFVRCTFMMDKIHNGIIRIATLTEERVNREELQNKCLPNIKITNSKVYLDETVKNFNIIRIERYLYTYPISYLTSIDINGLDIYGTNADMLIIPKFAKGVETKNHVHIKLSRIKYHGEGQAPELRINLNNENPRQNTVSKRRFRLRMKEQ